MANKQLKTLKLHGLDDTYVIPSKPEDIGAAPIGLCETIYTATSDAEDITQLNAILETMGDGEYGGQAVVYAICKREYSIDQTPMHSWLYRIENINNLYARVEATTSLGIGCKMQRIRFNGEWQPWEHINPPMLVNQEYRTTERWLDKPVYTQLLPIGSWAKGGAIDYDISPHVIRYSGRIGNWTLPFINNSTDNQYSVWATFHNNSGKLRLGMCGGTGADGSGGHIQIWYYKI